MRKIIILILAALVGYVNASSQDTATINKWVRATFMIVGQKWIPSTERDKIEKFREIDEQKYNRLSDSLKMVYSSSGTAIFLYYDGVHYLITAKHNIMNNSDDTTDNTMVDRVYLAQNVESFGVRRETEISRFLSGLSLGENVAYTSWENDLCVINMDKIYPGFSAALVRRKFRPIEIDDLSEPKVGDRVFMVGYPGRLMSGIIRPSSAFGYNPYLVPIPTITKGVISNVDKSKTFFGVQIINVWGYSGSALVTNKGKMVGVTSRFHYTKKVDMSNIDQSALNYEEMEAAFGKLAEVKSLIKLVSK